MASRTDHPEGRQRLGDFEIVREIGRGGMGVVYEARQVSLNRKVALKVVGGGLGLSSNGVLRFRREAEAAAKLHHTNIVPVYATGEADGMHYYAMELIEGPSLDLVLRELRKARQSQEANADAKPETSPSSAATDAPRPDLAGTGPYVPGADASSPSSGLSASSLSSGGEYFDTVARMVAEVAGALEYAHKNGVIHRDIKPSNLLVSPDGRLSINDFGLARVLEQPGMTVSGEFVGTPAYMSPEQIAAGRIPLDHRTDVYSLGATLYELLTLTPPFQGRSREQVLAQIVQKEPRPPRKVNKRVPVDLETICLKALDKDPDQRYLTAGQMAEDLHRYINRFAISARRAGPVRRLGKWVRRRPGLAAALACAIVLALATGFFAYRSHIAEQERLVDKQRQEEQLLAEKRQNALDKALLVAMSGDLDEAEKAIGEAERLGASTGQLRMLRGQVALHRGRSDEAIQHLEQAVVLMPDSVAARAMLGSAYANVGQHEQLDQLMAEIEQRTCVTPEDFLFKGYFAGWLDPINSLTILDEAVRRSPSVIARAIRAEIRSYRAIDTGNPADAELALKDANAAREMLPDNPYVLGQSLWAHMVAASVYEETRQVEKRRAALAQAASDARALERFPTLPDAVMNRVFFFWATDDLDACEKVCRANEKTENPLIAHLHSLVLYRLGKLDKALEIIEHTRPRPFYEDLRIFLLMDLPDGRARALDTLKKSLAREKKTMQHRVTEWSLLRMLGRKEEAVAAGLAFRRQSGQWPRAGRALSKGLLDYHCDLLSEDKLLRVFADSRNSQCIAHYCIALRKLADGDRRSAREHFRKAVATRAIASHKWDLSRAFLARMENDPAWPMWVPVKE
jgi:serine/threonine protein kinase